MIEKSTIMNEKEIKITLKRLAYEILEKNKDYDMVCLVGIKTRGVPMANFIADFLRKTEGIALPVGILDISFYRDDLTLVNKNPVINESRIPFSIDDKIVVLLDDVLFSGKTVQKALEGLYTLGKPRAVQLCVLIDRGHHTIPIAADFTGKIVPTSKDEVIKVNFYQSDKQENVKIMIKS